MTSLRIKDVTQINRKVLPENTDPNFRFRYIDIGSVDNLGRVNIPDEEVNFSSAPSRARRLAPAGAVAVSTVRTYLRAIAHVPEFATPLVFSTGFAILEAGAQIDSRFLAHYCQSQAFVDEVVARSVGVSFPAINAADIGNLPIVLPDREEQRRIADFLDAETARIDSLDTSRSAQLNLLAARERAMLDLSFREARSATRTRLKYLFSVRPRYGVLVPVFTDEGVPFIRVNDLLDLEGRADGLRNIPSELSAQYARSVVQPGDLLMSVVGTLGRAAIAPASLAGANIARAVCSMRFMPEVEVELVKSWLGTSAFHKQALVATSTDTAQPTLGMEDLGNFALTWPSDPQERKHLVREIARIQDSMRRLSSKLERQKSVLAERRQALITAAVTGQIDVFSASGRGIEE
ncbi:restriction endonuclease subunit S [Streptomyces sp. ALI-76-A]|uniref:restriction endonuclease subunit S n=1 Tax=Streptomyces sp. ALI-76-A TaxID=3025736 RepID=UPI00256E9B6A|nr:restriction endonuclease subunit S [Streptomyces sp. ALI-76-A]MDL5201274.1 restriction endonuclease subunit S [Streptomyces sp. ALI-76-A]